MAGEFDYCLAYKFSSLYEGIQTCMREKACNVLMHQGEEYLAVTFLGCDAVSLDLMRSAMGKEMKQAGSLVFKLKPNETAAGLGMHNLQFKDRFLVDMVFTLKDFEEMCLPSEESLGS